MQSVILVNANQLYNLFTLMKAVDSAMQRHVQAAQIQLDLNAGAANLYIGDALLCSSTNCGVQLVASQAFSIPSLSSNLVVLDDVGVMSDTAGVRINITVIAR